jgi:hypothetical protein
MRIIKVMNLLIQTVCILYLALGKTSIYVAALYEGMNGSFHILTRVWQWLMFNTGLSSNAAHPSPIWIFLSIASLVFIGIIQRKISDKHMDIANSICTLCIFILLMTVYFPMAQFIDTPIKP